MRQSSDYTAPWYPAVDIAMPFTLQSVWFIYYHCVIPLCLLISSRGVSDELNEILMMELPRVRGRRHQLRLSDAVQSDTCRYAHTVHLSTGDRQNKVFLLNFECLTLTGPRWNTVCLDESSKSPLSAVESC